MRSRWRRARRKRESRDSRGWTRDPGREGVQAGGGDGELGRMCLCVVIRVAEMGCTYAATLQWSVDLIDRVEYRPRRVGDECDCDCDGGSVTVTAPPLVSGSGAGACLSIPVDMRP